MNWSSSVGLTVNVVEEDPIKQGLKPLIKAGITPILSSCRGRSNKTRIETIKTSFDIWRLVGVVEEDPIKQGLKPLVIVRNALYAGSCRGRSNKTRIET